MDLLEILQYGLRTLFSDDKDVVPHRRFAARTGAVHGIIMFVSMGFLLMILMLRHPGFMYGMRMGMDAVDSACMALCLVLPLASLVWMLKEYFSRKAGKDLTFNWKFIFSMIGAYSMVFTVVGLAIVARLGYAVSTMF